VGSRAVTRTLIAGAFVATATVAAGVWHVRAQAAEPAHGAGRFDPDTMLIVPDNQRVKVEVINASGERGIARRTMHYLRDRGFDVVSLGNARERSDSSVVYVRSGHADWAALAARAIGGARIEERPDTSRYLDLTIVLGTHFRPPSLILYP
jgi:hypothetical protein